MEKLRHLHPLFLNCKTAWIARVNDCMAKRKRYLLKKSGGVVQAKNMELLTA